MSKAEQSHPAYQFGTDAQFRKWLSYQPSALDGDFNQWDGEIGRNIPCHVRRAGASGTGFKPPYSCVPLTDALHQVQSRHGEAAVFKEFLGYSMSNEEAKEWFDKQAEFYLERWVAVMKSKLKQRELA